MDQSERHSLEDIQILEDKRRKAAERVRRLLEELEAAEREFDAATRKVDDAGVLFRSRDNKTRAWP